jgi:agmatine deiminase
VTEEDESDANHAPLQANLERLRSLAIDGKPLEIMTLPMPDRIVREGLRLPASYANFYIANQSILLPTFADLKDEEAVTVLQRAFPTRRIIPIDCRETIWGLGAFHCLTQQQPAL